MLSGAMGTAGGQGKSPSNKGGKKVSIAPSQPSGKLSGPAMIELEVSFDIQLCCAILFDIDD